MNYMLAATEIPDWIFACAKNCSDAGALSLEFVTLIHERSPVSVIQNVKTPLLLMLGQSDLRVPTH
jgi:dipeptidyl aminopeptidase/acylaminoacyl peptidase